ncbi:MAG: MarR family transcriptional regulator [Methanocalculus sp. MSAO_Arc2]|uniref:MarR family winged helix-turn-helix transcriptional regulator n=1 Tax=Methanocalculus sp. MSAO_Arc2 TaxID=2293855 RepID=UPI000FF38D27|nr:MAG: MarR family transcriptional regulator [Methanocalculus sp. MSAO_Arc2]
MHGNKTSQTPFKTDSTGCPILNKNQEAVVLNLFEHGQSYGNALATITNLEQQTVSAIIQRLEAGKLVCFSEYNNPPVKGAPRKMYSLTAAGFFAAIMVLLKNDDTPLDTAQVIEKGISQYSTMQFGDIVCSSVFLNKWSIIIQKTKSSNYILLSTSENYHGWSEKQRVIFETIEKKYPYGMWFLALRLASREMYRLFIDGVESTYAHEGDVGYYFDLIFGGFIAMGSEEGLLMPYQLDFCCSILKDDDELMSCMLCYIEEANNFAKKAIEQYEAVIAKYHKK